MRSEPKTRLIDAKELRLTAAALALEAKTTPYHRDQLGPHPELQPGRAPGGAHAAQAATELRPASVLYFAPESARAPAAHAELPGRPERPDPPQIAARWRARLPLVLVPALVAVAALLATLALSAPEAPARLPAPAPPEPAPAPPARSSSSADHAPPAVLAPARVAPSPPPTQPPAPASLPPRPPAAGPAHAPAAASPRAAVEALVAGKHHEAVLAYRALSPAPRSTLATVLRLLESELARTHKEGEP